MERIVTVAPIPLAVLKRKFTEDIHFVIDYTDSKFRGKTLINYLSNLDISCSLQLTNKEDALELVLEYMRIPAAVSLPDLENVVINLLLAAQGKVHFLSFDPSEFLVEHQELIAQWLRRIASLRLYAIHCWGKDEAFVNSFPVDEDNSIAGINFVQLIKHELFVLLVADIPESEWSYNKMWFNDYVFGGKNMFHFFAVKENPLFLGLVSATDPSPEDSELPKLYAEVKAEYLAISKDSPNVPLI